MAYTDAEVRAFRDEGRILVVATTDGRDNLFPTPLQDLCVVNIEEDAVQIYDAGSWGTLISLASGVVDGLRFRGRGTSHTASDYALSAGWGDTATVSTVAARDTGGRIIITCGGSGIAANPEVVLTYKDGAWPSGVAPAIVVCRGDLNAPTTGFWAVTNVSSTAPRITFVGTPVSGTTYTFYFIVMGR